jgi:squalene-hopene/tetraprenyl-beta-curcumene cyclase
MTAPRRLLPPVLCLIALALVFGSSLSATGAPVDAKQYQKTVDKALEYLNTHQAADGSFSSKAGPAVTALIVTSVIRSGRPTTDPVVAKGLKYLEGFVQPTGGIHAPNSRITNYETCLAIVCFSEANADGKYREILEKADKFVKGSQLDESEDLEKSNVNFGGASYGGGKQGRPDLSNTHYLVEALRAAGNDYNSDSVQKALVFVSRCQNLESEHNTTPFAAKINDGGFYYTPAAGGEGKKEEEGGLKSYGSMTYAGLKSMIFAGVGPDDPRVKAAVGWISKNYDVKTNPGQGDAGLYYYYHLFAKALDAMKIEEIKDAAGKEHSWRQELVAELASRQQANGSWVNTNEKWMEGDPNLATGFALLSLSYCKPSAPVKGAKTTKTK